MSEALEREEIKGHAFYLGKQPFEDMVQILKHSDMFVMPNIKVMGDAEGFGLVALEASVNGTPVIASSLEGITCAVIDGKNGFLVPPENEGAWIEKIHAILSDTSHLKEFGELAKQFTITNFAWKKMVDGYLTVFNKYNYQRMYREENNQSADNDYKTGLAGPMVLDNY